MNTDTDTVGVEPVEDSATHTKRSNIEAIFPLRPLQRALMLYAGATIESTSVDGSRAKSADDTGDPGFLQVRFSLFGRLSPNKLRRAWEAVIRRHSALRMSVHSPPAQRPMLVVWRKVTAPWSFLDWRDSPKTEQIRRMTALLDDDRRRGLDPAQAPVMRMSVIHTGQDRHQLVWSCHHLFVDGWSAALVVNDLLTEYHAAQPEGHPSPGPVECSYRDYMTWFKGRSRAETAAYWRRVLADISPARRLQITQRHPQAMEPTGGFGDRSLSVGLDESRRLRAACITAQITPNALLQGAWALLLGLFQHTDDVVFGATVSGRPADIDGITSLVGFFNNSIPRRVRIDSDLSTTTWLRRIRDQQLATQPFEYAQSADIQAWIGLPGYRRLFENLLVVQNYPSQPQSLNSDLALTDFRSGITSRYPLTVAVVPSDCWSLAGHFDRGRFSAAAVDSLLALFRSLLSELAKAMDAPLAQAKEWLHTAGHDVFALDPPPTVTATGLVGDDTDGDYRPPQNLQELQITAIWEETLGIDGIGIHDNFFALGGHSLLATSVTARIESALRTHLPLRSLFDAPTIAELSQEIDTLRNGGQNAVRKVPEPIDRGRLGSLPLSFAQQRIWFLEQMEGELTAYNMPFAWRLHGILDTEALRRALERVVQRHEALRTTFAMLDEHPIQIIGSIERFDLSLQDLAALTPEQQKTEVVRRCRLEAERPFDLNGDPMLRASLLRLSEQAHVLLLTMHHIASDGWSLQILWRELRHLYDACLRGADSDLPELPLQYADYTVWQRNTYRGRRLEALLQYWRGQLDGVKVLELPTDRPRPSVPTYQAAEYDFELRDGLVEQLKSLSRAEGTTLHMTLLAAFQVLLARYSGQDDIAVGTPIAGRNDAALEDLVGFFVNTLVLRTDLSGNPGFRELLGRVRQVSLSAYDHQDLPFERLVEELQPPRHLSRNPLVQVLFQLLNFPDHDLALRDLETSRLPSHSQHVRFDLEMHLSSPRKKVHGTICYSKDLFDRSTIERMVGHFVTLLEEIAADADRRICELPILTKAERHRLFVEWNNTATDYPRGQSVHGLFEQQVERTPDAVSVVFGDQKLTYRELNRRANQLAHHLRRLGVGPETLVGLSLERSADLVVGILGILKAGGAYLPLDTDYPRQRLQLMLEDAGAQLIVTRQELLGGLPDTGCRVVCLDTDAAALQGSAGTNPPSGADADNLAYVMFTSGSTGQPKGVAIRHRSIARLVFGTELATFGQERVFLLLADVAFDASTFEIWGALLHGARLIVAPTGMPDIGALGELIERNQVTTLWLTAAFFNQVVEHHPEVLSGVDEILTGGEALSVRYIRKAQVALGSGTRLVNGYGPTEGTTFTTCYRIPEGVAAEVGSIPIGRPIGNTRVYLLDAQREPVPIGVPGELYIGGVGLARGYLNRPELTAERFVADPFDRRPDARLYRTGDLCRWRNDGNLEYLGRLDDQVKLRGFRIEPGEIELVLDEHPGVTRSVVTLHEVGPDDKRLVAYWVPAMGMVPSAAELMNHLRSRLPAYMLPSSVVRLEVFPLTSSGKIDRRGLPAPGDAWTNPDTGYVAPHTPTEEKLASIWRDVLSVERVGVNDDFFALGGHSLLAIALFARIEETFGCRLPLASLFQHGTISHLSNLIVGPTGPKEVASALPLHTGGDARPVFLMPNMGGELMFSVARALIDELDGRVPIVGIQPTAPITDLQPFRDFRTTADCFVEALRRYQPEGPYTLLGYSHGGMMAYEVACVLSEAGEEIDLLAVIDSGPGHKDHERRFGDHAKQWSRGLANLPLGLREEFRRFSGKRLTGRVARKLRRIYRVLLSGGRAGVELDDIFDVAVLERQDQALMQAAFAAFCDYQPRRYAGTVTLFRSSAEPLLSGYARDLGWTRFVGALEVHRIDGDHESILYPPHVGALARQLGELLEKRQDS